MTRICSILISALLAVAPAAEASQNQLSSPTTGTVSGLQLTNNYNNGLDSLNTCNSGASAPTNQLSGVPSEGNCWLNTTSNPHVYQFYDGAQWLKAGYFDTVNHLWDGVVGGGTASVASAATTDPCSSAANYLTITGTTTITSFGSTCEAGQEKTVTFAAALMLTYNATSLILPGAANVTTAAGDIARLRYLGSSNWQVEAYFPATGQALVNPAVPIGTKLDFAGYTVPANFLEGYGQTVSRTTYANLLTALTSVQSVGRTNGSPTLTGFTDTTRFGFGQCVEGTGIPNTGSCTTSIQSCTSTTCTLNNNASSTGTANVTVFFYGNGDGSTTFGMPDCRGKAVVARDNIGGSSANVAQVAANLTTSSGSASATVSSATGIAAGMYVINPNVPAGTTISSISGTAITLSANASANGTNVGSRFSVTKDAQMMGSTGGSPVHTQTVAEMATHGHGVTDPGHTHTITNGVTAGGLGYVSGTNPVNYSSPTTVTTNSATTGITINNAGGSEPMLQQNPSLVLTCIVRVSRLATPPALPGSPRQFAANDDAIDPLAIIERRRAA